MATRATVEDLRARAAHDLGLDDAALGVDGDVHRQLAVELLAAELSGKLRGAAVFDLAAQLVVVERVDLFARGRADVALLRPRVLLVDALLDLGEQLRSAGGACPPARAPRACPGRAADRCAGSRASSRRICVSSCCCVCCICSICLRVSSLASPSSVSADGGSGEVARPAVGLAAAGEVGLGDRLGLVGRLVRARVDEDHLERRVLEDAVEAAGSTKRTVSSTACTPIDAISAICSVERRPAIVASGRCVDSATRRAVAARRRSR